MMQKKIDWLLIVPIVICVGCSVSDVMKLLQSNSDLVFIDILNIFNCNVFSAFFSIVICLLVQFFSKDKKRRSKSRDVGLNPRYIPLTVCSSIGYFTVYIVNVCRFCSVTSWILFICSVIYICVFFVYMLNKNVNVGK